MRLTFAEIRSAILPLGILIALLFGFNWPLHGQVEFGNLGKGNFGQSNEDEPLTLSAQFKLFDGSRQGTLTIDAKLADHWHIYSLTQPPGGPTKTTIKIPDSEKYRLIGEFAPSSPPQVVELDPVFKIRVEQHEFAVAFSAPIELPEGVDPTTLKIDVDFRALRCNESGCLPVKEKLVAAFAGYEKKPENALPINTDVPEKKAVEPDGVKTEVKDTPSQVDSDEQIAEMKKLYDPDSKINYLTLKDSKGTTTFWPAFLGIFLGGIILNLMPCVFPVLGLKVLGFVELGGSNSKRVALHGLAFTMGIVASMWLLGGAILILKLAFGQNVNWGQQMGNPYFVGAIIIVMFVLGLNLAGVFEMGMFMTRLGNTGKKQKGYGGSFFSGILTTFVATPCSGPFLGAAMSYTLSQRAEVAMLLFTIFALGIALPYLMLSFFPSLINALPRPGMWMETFKQLMSFALFATAAFFLRTFAKQTGIDGVTWLVMALCVIAIALYFHGHWCLPHLSSGKRYVWGMLVPLVIGGTGIWMYLDSAQKTPPVLAADQIGGLTWEKWYPGKVEQRVSQKKIVWVDYTADW